MTDTPPVDTDAAAAMLRGFAGAKSSSRMWDQLDANIILAEREETKARMEAAPALRVRATQFLPPGHSVIATGTAEMFLPLVEPSRLERVVSRLHVRALRRWAVRRRERRTLAPIAHHLRDPDA